MQDRDFQYNRSAGFRCDAHTPKQSDHFSGRNKWEGENIYNSQYGPLEIVKLADIGYSGVSSIATLHAATRFMRKLRTKSASDIVLHSNNNEKCVSSLVSNKESRDKLNIKQSRPSERKENRVRD
jgi:hypothetical protein